MSEYNYQRVTPAHYPLLQVLYMDAFSSTTTVPDIKKRFDTIDLGCEHIGFIAIHTNTGQPAAYYGVYPVKFLFTNQLLLAAQSGDTMTHSQHRLKGLFTQLAKLTFDECSKKKIYAVFGFPNENSFPGFIKKLQWQQIDTIVRFDLKHKIKTIPLSKFYRRSRFLRKIYSYYSRLILRRKITNPPTSFINTYPANYAKIYRDEKYLNYKESPEKLFIKIDDQIIWIKLIDVFWIGDFSDYQLMNSSIIKKLKRLAFLLGYNTISFHINESVQQPGFLKNFKKYNTEPSCILYLDDAVKPENFLFTAADFDTW
ncbi:MAG: GNAT family N-acetyltransferase [Chitinophagaceae bacterium]